MLVTLYNFSKRPNSTLEPNPNNSTSLTLSGFEIKEGTSFLNPTLIISPKPNPPQVFSPTQFNYASIPYWMRYYFIKDWRWSQGVWEVDLTVDVLASFKGAIGDTSAYIVRASRSYDGSVMDKIYPSKTNVDIVKVPVTTAWYGVSPSGGSYVVGILNYQNTNKVGAVSYYALTSAQFGKLMAYLMSDSIFWSESIDEIGEGLYKSIFDPCQYIVSCLWFPFDTSAFGSSSTTIKVGYWTTNTTGVIVSSLLEKTYITATIPDHPQIARGQYLNREPYTRLTLYLPPFGEIPLDTNYLSLGNYLYSACVIDHITGQATLRLSFSDYNNRDEYKIFTERTGQIGVPIQISQILQDYIGSVNSAVGGISNISSVGDILAYGAAGILDFVSNLGAGSKKTSTVGANGSFIECLLAPVVTVEHFLLSEENRDEFGRPLMDTRVISTLPGYIQCGEGDHAFPCTADEKDKINNFLKSGFFYE